MDNFANSDFFFLERPLLVKSHAMGCDCMVCNLFLAFLCGQLFAHMFTFLLENCSPVFKSTSFWITLNKWVVWGAFLNFVFSVIIAKSIDTAWFAMQQRARGEDDLRQHLKGNCYWIECNLCNWIIGNDFFKVGRCYWQLKKNLNIVCCRIFYYVKNLGTTNVLTFGGLWFGICEILDRMGTLHRNQRFLACQFACLPRCINNS